MILKTKISFNDSPKPKSVGEHEKMNQIYLQMFLCWFFSPPHIHYIYIYTYIYIYVYILRDTEWIYDFIDYDLACFHTIPNFQFVEDHKYLAVFLKIFFKWFHFSSRVDLLHLVFHDFFTLFFCLAISFGFYKTDSFLYFLMSISCKISKIHILFLFFFLYSSCKHAYIYIYIYIHIYERNIYRSINICKLTHKKEHWYTFFFNPFQSEFVSKFLPVLR